MDLRLINKQKSLSRSLRDSDSDPTSLIKLVSEGIMIRAIRANISAILAVLEPLKGVPRKTTPAVDLSTSLKLSLLAESKAYSIRSIPGPMHVPVPCTPQFTTFIFLQKSITNSIWLQLRQRLQI